MNTNINFIFIIQSVNSFQKASQGGLASILIWGGGGFLLRDGLQFFSNFIDINCVLGRSNVLTNNQIGVGNTKILHYQQQQMQLQHQQDQMRLRHIQLQQQMQLQMQQSNIQAQAQAKFQANKAQNSTLGQPNNNFGQANNSFGQPNKHQFQPNAMPYQYPYQQSPFSLIGGNYPNYLAMPSQLNSG
jgi:hypothetical protein